MKKYKIKVCGMKYPDNIRGIAELLPNYMGFIFYESSKRYVGEDLDELLLHQLPSQIEKVGVFVNQSSNYILNKAKKYHFTHVQLHGNESVGQCDELKAQGLRIIKAFSVGSDFNFEQTKAYKQSADFFLVDTKTETYGGSGKKFDWNVLADYDNDVPLFLSGGLDIESVPYLEKLEQLNIHALDINSKFELSPGLKDKNRVDAFIKLIR